MSLLSTSRRACICATFCAAAAIGHAADVPQVMRGDPLEFSTPRDKGTLTNLNELKGKTPQVTSTREGSQDTPYRRSDWFRSSSGPDLETPPPFQNNTSSGSKTKQQKLQEDRVHNWVFMTPAEYLGVAQESNDESEKDQSPMERYLKKKQSGSAKSKGDSATTDDTADRQDDSTSTIDDPRLWSTRPRLAEGIFKDPRREDVVNREQSRPYGLGEVTAANEASRFSSPFGLTRTQERLQEFGELLPGASRPTAPQAPSLAPPGSGIPSVQPFNSSQPFGSSMPPASDAFGSAPKGLGGSADWGMPASRSSAWEPGRAAGSLTPPMQMITPLPKRAFP